jgi:hypothetical protein
LLRDGIDLAFETDLLYLDVANGRIGINSDTPTRTLFVNDTVGSPNLIVTTQASIANFTISTNTIQDVLDAIYITPDQTTDPQIVTDKVGTLNLRVSSQLIENITSNSNIEISPTGKVVFNTTTVYITGGLHATGNITWDGDIVFGNNSADNVSFGADVASNIIPNDDNTDDLGSLLQQWNSIYTTNLYVGTRLTTNDLGLASLNLTGVATFNGNLFFGNNSTDHVTFNALVTSDLIPTTSTFSLGNSTTPAYWNNLFLSNLDVDGVTNINNNIISILAADTNLELSAAGTGKVIVPNNVSITNNLEVTSNVFINGSSTVNDVNADGTTTIVGNISQTGNTYVTGTFANNNIAILSPSFLEIPNIKISSNVISNTALNQNLEFYANGTGGIAFNRQLRITDNVISNIFDTNNIELAFNNLWYAEDGQLLITEDGDAYLIDAKNDRDLSIIIRPSDNANVIIDSTKALGLAVGNATHRVLELPGEIRYNDAKATFEGYEPLGTISFLNIYDTDGNTYVTPELIPGANDNTIRFGINGTVKSNITSTGLYTTALQSGNVFATGSTITNINNALDLVLDSTSGITSINDVLFGGNSITNTADTALTFVSTGTGYVKFTGTAGLVLPTGDASGRRLTPEVGETRYNTDAGYVEVWNGVSWKSVAGAQDIATREQVDTELEIWTLILG